MPKNEIAIFVFQHKLLVNRHDLRDRWVEDLLQTTDHVRLCLPVCSALDPIECFLINGVNRKCCSVEEIIQSLPRIPPGQVMGYMLYMLCLMITI